MGLQGWMGWTACAMAVLCGYVRAARADGPEASSQAYVLQVFKAEVAPTKVDGHVWDGTKLLKDLPDPKGVSAAALATAIAKKIAEGILAATEAPDVFVTVRVGTKTLRTTTRQDAYQSTWEPGDASITTQLAAGDTLAIVVADKDASVNDPVGGTLHKLTQDELAAGVIDLGPFEQVISLELAIAPVEVQELLYSPGRYKVIVHGATIAAKKPAGDTNAGKAWDVLGGDPDVQGEVTIGQATLVLPKQQDALKPSWDVSTEIDLDAASSLSVRFVDKDVSGDKGDDRIGTLWTSVLLTEAPKEDGLIHLTDQAAIADFTVELVPIASPVTAADCRELATHLAALAEAAGDDKLVEEFKSPKPENLRACVTKTKRAELECAMASTDLVAVAKCASP